MYTNYNLDDFKNTLFQTMKIFSHTLIHYRKVTNQNYSEQKCRILHKLYIYILYL